MTGVAVFRDVCIDATDPELVGRFWGAVLGREVQVIEDADVLLDRGADGGPRIWVNRVPEPKVGKVRIHLDVTMHTAEVVAPLVAVGATVLHEPFALAADQGWWVMADPEGHEFCAFAPSEEPA